MHYLFGPSSLSPHPETCLKQANASVKRTMRRNFRTPTASDSTWKPLFKILTKKKPQKKKKKNVSLFDDHTSLLSYRNRTPRLIQRLLTVWDPGWELARYPSHCTWRRSCCNCCKKESVDAKSHVRSS